MRKLKFKLIPFLISLFIVIGSVSGITLYSYYKYDNNKIRFIANYFHYEDHSSIDTPTQIENFVKFEADYYKLITDEIKYYDASSNQEYTSSPSKLSTNFINGATFKDGILHLPGYFDIAFYLQTNYSKDSDSYVYTYYAYIYNVNYAKAGANIVNHLYISFVNGKGESPENELYGTTKLDLVMDEVKNGKNGSPNGVNEPSYTYSNGTVASEEMYIYDNNHNGSDYTNITTPHVYRLVTMTESPANTSSIDDTEEQNRWMSELETCTFSIFYSGANDLESSITSNDGTISDLKEIVRGTIDRKYETAKDFNEAEDVKAGAAKSVYKSGYFNYIFKTLLIEGLITFVISFIIAFLFYLIWQDDEEDQKVKINYNKTKKNS